MATWLTPGQDPWDDDLKTYIDDTADAVADAATDDATAAVSAIVDGVVATATADITAAADAAVAAASAVAIGTWQATTPYTSAQTVQAPDGSLIKANSSRTSRASFDATEQTFWTPVSTKSGTVEKAALDAVYGGLAANNHFSGQVGFGTSSPSARIPFLSNQAIDAAAAGSTDKVAHELNSLVTGDLSTSTGSDPTFFWGLNVFSHTGTSANDGKGGNLSNLIEFDVQSPSGTIATVFGLAVEASFFGATAGATVTQMASLRVNSPVRKNGATGGVATGVYGAFIDTVVTATLGSTTAFALFVNGGVSRFGGRVDVTNQIANNGSGDLEIDAGFGSADGGKILLVKTANGNSVALTPRVAIGSNFPGWGTSAAGAQVFLANITTAPTSNPSGGGFLYVSSGALVYRGTSGTVTTIAPA